MPGARDDTQAPVRTTKVFNPQAQPGGYGYRPPKPDPQNQQGGYGYKPPTSKPPAWLGGSSIGDNSNEPEWMDTYRAYNSPTGVGDISNPNVPIQAIGLDVAPTAVAARIRAGAPNLATGDLRYQNQVQALKPKTPSWLENLGNLFDVAKARTGPSLYSTADPESQDGEIVASGYHGRGSPENNPYYYAVPPYIADIPLPEEGSGDGGGFGTRYRGWGGRGGGGGYDTPGWFNNLMNLYSWNYKG